MKYPSLSSRRPSVIKAVEKAIKDDGIVLCTLKDGKKYQLFPHCLLILHGHLNIIGEETLHRHLISLSVQDITQCGLKLHQKYQANFSQVEIEDFIYAMRAVEDSEERLVLKVLNPRETDLNPPYHFLGGPYQTTNREGELIWAASVEVSSELFRWLEKIQNHIEIVDPQEIRSKFAQYLDDNQKK